MEIHLNTSDPSPRPDWSALSLIATNALTIAVAVYQKWNPATVMWIYWGQSVIIGVFNAMRMWTLQNFTTDGVMVNDQPVAPTTATKHQMAIFFMLHYGFFHLIYAVFLSEMAHADSGDVLPIAICVVVFLANHLFSYGYNKKEDAKRKLNLGKLMAFPYARIIPLHIAIIAGAAFSKSAWALVLFLSLKTVADLIMHAVEHRVFGRADD